MATQLRGTFLPYSTPMIGEAEINEVVDSLRSGWITTGPKVKRFEADFAAYVGSTNAIAVSSCTAALHLTLSALGTQPGDEVILPTLTFCSTANVVEHLGATPIIVDVNQNMQISVEAVERAISPRTRAIVPVHYGGQPCDLRELKALADARGIPLVEDAAHAAGCDYEGRKIGTHGRATAFSFYANKNMTTAEGGMITTDDDALAAKLRVLALHGMSRDAWKRYTQTGNWYYEVTEAGYKCNMTDIQAALGIHQLRRLEGFNRRRQQLARTYTEALKDIPGLKLPLEMADRSHIYHVYAIWLDPASWNISRAEFIEKLTERRIGVSVHFIPLHRHPFYRDRYKYSTEAFPVAEQIYAGLLSLPCYPAMSDDDVTYVTHTIREIADLYSCRPSTAAAA